MKDYRCKKCKGLLFKYNPGFKVHDIADIFEPTENTNIYNNKDTMCIEIKCSKCKRKIEFTYECLQLYKYDRTC